MRKFLHVSSCLSPELYIILAILMEFLQAGHTVNWNDFTKGPGEVIHCSSTSCLQLNPVSLILDVLNEIIGTHLQSV